MDFKTSQLGWLIGVQCKSVSGRVASFPDVSNKFGV